MSDEENEFIDVSGYIMDSEQDDGDRRYRLVLHCEDDHRVNDDAEVNCTISGKRSRRLTVTIGNKIYYRKKLPGSASGWRAQIKKKDLVVITIQKSEPGLWKH